MFDIDTYFADLKIRLIEWYNRNFQAGWYASASLIGGWLSAAIAWTPDLLNWVLVDHFDFFGRFIFPTMSPEVKAIFLSLYITFIAPPLRAKIQKWMQKKAIKQQAEAGKVVPLPASGVSVDPSAVGALQRSPNEGGG